MTVFTVTLTPRQYETDFNGHLNALVYLQWIDHARIEYLRRAGISLDDLVRNNLGPVLLEVRIRYLAELRFGNEVTVSVENTFGTSKTWKVHHRFTRPDGTVAAEVDTVMGLFDPTTRRLAANPRGAMQSLAAHPDLL